MTPNDPTRIDLDALIELRRQAGALDLSSRPRVMTDLAGAHASGFRGRGMEFDDYRVYQPGDDLRAMDWRVTARTGTPHIRLYHEERERPVILCVDLRPAMWFATRGRFKSVCAAQAAALCAWAALENRDRVGGLCFDGDSHVEVRPGSRRQLLHWLHALSTRNAQPGQARPDAFAQLLRRLLRTARPGALVGLFSDFRGLGAMEAALLRKLGQRVELILGFAVDPIEWELPPAGRYPLIDADGQIAWIDTSQRTHRQRWTEQYRTRREAAESAARTCRAHWVELRTDRDPVESLSAALGRRRQVA
ncbi:DUF58 domain-containing protein [uncultured Abyssibacter sp.]|uniref:DUF58 domain-containing protein n=1 Tax=uncultured Abyssibacter sp. TaxID=2320202 RepID=UPI0032B2B11D